MSFYRDVRIRILAGVLVFVMVLSTITISQNTNAATYNELTYHNVSVNTGDYIAEIYENDTDTMVQLTGATFAVYQLVGQSFSYQVSVYQNQTNSTDPTSGECMYTGSTTKVSALEDSDDEGEKVPIAIDLSSAGIYLSAGETASVVVTFVSVGSASASTNDTTLNSDSVLASVTTVESEIAMSDVAVASEGATTGEEITESAAEETTASEETTTTENDEESSDDATEASEETTESTAEEDATSEETTMSKARSVSLASEEDSENSIAVASDDGTDMVDEEEDITTEGSTTLTLYNSSSGTGFKNGSSVGVSFFAFTTSEVSADAVVEGIDSISLGTTKLFLSTGDTYTFTATLDPAVKRTITYTSDSDCVSVSGSTITAVSTGKATITASVESSTETRSVDVYVIDATLDGSSFAYTGSAIEPEPTVTCGSGTTLTEDTDYELSYTEDHVNVGTKTVTIKGLTGTDYEGYSETLEYEITEVDIEDLIDSATFDINTSTDTVNSVTFKFKEGTDNTLSSNLTYEATATPDGNSSTGTSVTYYYDITVTGTGNYTGTYTADNYGVSANVNDDDESGTYNIAELYNIDYDATEFTYNNTMQVPTPLFTNKQGGTVTLAEGTHYTVAYTDSDGNTVDYPTNAGTYYITVSGRGAYTGSFQSQSFTINACSLSGLAYKVNDTDYEDDESVKAVYTGSEIYPEVSITLQIDENSSYTLKEGTDYSINSYTDNEDIGDYIKIKIGNKGGNFTGSKTLYVEIIGDLAENATVKIGTASSSKTSTGVYSSTYSTTYTGSAIEPTSSVTVTMNNSQLTQGTDYQVSYTDANGAALPHTDAGTAQLRLVGMGKYAGQSAIVTFTIEQMALSANAITFDVDANSRTYNGSAQTLDTSEYSLTNSNTGSKLTEGTENGTGDYYITYSDNTDAGSATITAYGQGNYTGSVSETFAISQLNISNNDNVVISIPTSKTYTGSAITLADDEIKLYYKETDDGNDSLTELSSTAGYTVGYKDNTAIGNATVTLTGSDNLTGSTSATFEITRRNLSNDKITISVEGELATYDEESSVWKSDYTTVYNGSTHMPSLTVTYEGETLSSSDYSATYSSSGEYNNLDAGTAHILVTGIGSYDSTATIEYTITPTDISNVTITPYTDADGNATYADDTGTYMLPYITLKDTGTTPSTTLIEDTHYTITPEESAKSAGNAEITITAVDGTNYTGSTTYSYTIGESISGYTLTLIDPVTGGEVNTTTDFVYKGESIEPIAVVKASGDSTSTLTEWTDYTVAYTGDGDDSTDIHSAGTTVTVTVTAVDSAKKYYGTLTATYKVTRTTIEAGNGFEVYSTDSSNQTITKNENGTYTMNYTYAGGDDIDVQLGLRQISDTLSDASIVDATEGTTSSGAYILYTLKEDTDYTLSSDTVSGAVSSSSTGTSVTLSAVSGGNYRQSITVYYVVGTIDLATEGRFTITNNIADQTYTGSAIEPTDIVIYDNVLNRTLVQGTDYTLSYGGDNINVGTDAASVIITGTGNYSGTRTTDSDGEDLTFTIAARPLSAATVAAIPDQEYTGSAITLEDVITVTYDDTTLDYGTDYTLSYEDNTYPGTATVTITATPGGNYSGTKTETFIIYGNLGNESLFTISGFDDYYTLSGGSLDLSDITVSYIGSGGTAVYLTANTDYTVSALNASSPTTSATIQVSGNSTYYRGTRNFTGVTVKGKLSDATITGINSSYDYTGSQITPIPTITYGSTTLTVSTGTETDCTVTYGDNTQVGLDDEGGGGTVTITSNNDLYTGSVTKTFDIKYNLATAEVTMDSTTYAYTGSAIEPSFTVACAGYYLSTSDYKVQYSNNVNKGTATITISSNSDEVTGNKTITFTIGGIDISENDGSIEVSFPDGFEKEQTYTGSEITPEMVVTHNGRTLTRYTDYNLKFENNEDVGEATVYVIGTGNYSGTVTKTFTIKQATLTEDMITVEDAYYAGGKAVIPEYTVTYNGITLVEDTDYTTGGFTGNTEVSGYTVNEQARMTFTGTGNFTGSVTVYFNILATDLSNGKISIPSTSKVYTGSVIEPEITVTCQVGNSTNYYTLVKGEDYTIDYGEYDEIKDAGNYTITVTAVSGSSFTGYLTLTFTVTPKDITSGVTFSEIPDQAYTGSEVTPYSKITVTDDNLGVLSYGTDYTVTFKNNVNSASKDDSSAPPTAIITGTGNYTGTKELYFNIGTALSSDNARIYTSDDIVRYTYDGTEHPLTGYIVYYGTTALAEDTDYTVTQPEDMVNAGSKTFTITGMGGYYGTLTKTYIIDPKTVSQGDLTIKLYDPTTNQEYSKNADGEYEVTYYGSAITPSVRVWDNDIGELASTDYTIAYRNNNQVSTTSSPAYVIVTPTGNYQEGAETNKQSFYINAREFNEDEFELEVEPSYPYTGEEITEARVKVNDGSTTPYYLTEGLDYTAEYENNINVGTATVTITGMGNYSGTLSETFNIYAFLENATVTIPTQFYTGEAVKPIPTVECGGNTLTYGEDFTVDWYSDDDYTTSGYMIITTTNGDFYRGSKTVDYVISTDTSVLVVSGYQDTYIYTGYEIKPDFVVALPMGTELTYDASAITYTHTDEDGNVVTGDVTNAGTVDATIPITIGDVNANLYVEYEIAKKPIASTNIVQLQTNTYTGKELTPQVYITYNGIELEEKEDYTVTYDDNIDPGVGTAEVTGIGNFTGSTTLYFKIVPSKVVNLSATANSTTSVTLNWTNGIKVTGYEVYSANSQLKYGYTSGNSFTIRGLSPGTTYTFKVRSYVDNWGETTYGEFSSVTVTTDLESPSGVTATSTTSKAATLSWDASDTGINGYQIYRSTSKNGTYKKVAVIPLSRLSYTNTGLTSGSTYYYKLRAYKVQSDGTIIYSEYSDPIKVTVK